MTRTNKWTMKSEQKWFTHHGYSDSDPTKTKKEGAGKNNWGQPGDECKEEFTHFNRRNSNHLENEEKLQALSDKLDKDLLKE
ncbi:ATPase stabilizing factor 15 kDa protein [Scheffersomyces xylosifermentans]|uniref:ATPase stabilizing factor 15 kDa protein n=1 Tax=Scheffersomyces xylosifermentans TaxID=1304137 RepID=UPI00315C8189